MDNIKKKMLKKVDGHHMVCAFN